MKGRTSGGGAAVVSAAFQLVKGGDATAMPCRGRRAGGIHVHVMLYSATKQRCVLVVMMVQQMEVNVYM